MEQLAATKPVARAQSSIRSFFQPRQPNYTPPPASANPKAKSIDKISQKSASPPLHPIAPKPQLVPQSTLPTLKSRLPPQASISTIHEEHIQPLKRINALLLPISYPDSFYHKIIDPQTSPNFSRVILWQDCSSLKSLFSTASNPTVIGGIVCRLERDESAKASSIYIQSLALLSPYRSYGLATAVLDDVIEGLVNAPVTEFPVTSLYAHVWTENTEGLEWYTARGFTREEPVIQGYYRRLQPGNAWIMRRHLAPSDHLRHSRTEGTIATTATKLLTTSTSAPPITTSSSALNGSSNTFPTPRAPPRGTSYQTTGPGYEWNDLPDDIVPGSGTSKSQTPDPSSTRNLSATSLFPPDTSSSTASSRSSSSTRNGGKKKRQYPAAAFNGAGDVTGGGS